MAASSKTLRIQVKRRRFRFKFGLSAVAVKECQKKRGGSRPSPWR